MPPHLLNVQRLCCLLHPHPRGPSWPVMEIPLPNRPSRLRWLSYPPLDPRYAGSNPAGVDEFLSERKNPEYDLLRKGREAVGPVS